MLENTDIPYSTKECVDYLIKFSLFSSDKIPDFINVPIIDIVIETYSDVDAIKNSAHSLIQITKKISEFVIKNDAIYYCYCSDKPIKRNINNIIIINSLNIPF